MRNRIYLFLILPILLLSTNLIAQATVEAPSVMRSNGKIYVVMAVVVIIMSGFFIYLINIDRKLSKLEKK